MLTPLDIHNKEFKRGFRGYVEDEVDDFLDQVVQEVEALLKDNAIFKEQLDEVNQQLDHYKQLEATLHSTLIVAQSTAEEVKQSAHKEAELILREAHAQADTLLREAEQRVREREGQLAQLQRQAIAFRAQVRSLLESQLELLRSADGAAASDERD